jgi:hypothetical protein
MPLNDLIVEAFRLDLAAKLIAAVLIGGGIGLERELKHKPAGLRTNILICLGSAILMDLSMSIAATHGGDPARIAAQVVTGIGFLGRRHHPAHPRPDHRPHLGRDHLGRRRARSSPSAPATSSRPSARRSR